MKPSEENILKEKLKRSADSYKDQLEYDVDESFTQLSKILKIGAFVAGGVLLGYSTYRKFKKVDNEDEQSTEETEQSNRPDRSVVLNILEPILKASAEVAAMYFLTIARQKLRDYITELDDTHTAANGHSTENN